MYSTMKSMGFCVTSRAMYSSITLLAYIIMGFVIKGAYSHTYYYSRTRNDPNHLRISEEFKNRYVDEIKYVSRINGTRYEYYISPRYNHHHQDQDSEYDQVNMLMLNEQTFSWSHKQRDLTSNDADQYELDQSIATSHLRTHDGMVFETIDKMFQHRLSPFYIHHYDSELDKRSASDPRLVSRESCARDLAYLVDNLPSLKKNSNNINYMKYSQPNRKHLTPELMALYDSFGKEEAGVLMGNIYWVGGYDQCINRHIFDLNPDEQFMHQEHDSQTDKHKLSLTKSSTTKATSQTNTMIDKLQRDRSSSVLEDRHLINFKGRYCVAALKSPFWDPMIRERQSRGDQYFKTSRQIREYEQLFRIQMGLCLPNSCDSTSLYRHHDEIKLLANSMLSEQYQHYDLIDLYCLPDETSDLRQWSGSARNFLWFMSVWFSLITMATLADVLGFVQMPLTVQGPKAVVKGNNNDPMKGANKVRTSRVQKFVLWFSLRQNYIKLMQVKETSDVKKEDTTDPDIAKQRQCDRINTPEHKLKLKQKRNQQSNRRNHIASAAGEPEMKPSTSSTETDEDEEQRQQYRRETQENQKSEAVQNDSNNIQSSTGQANQVEVKNPQIEINLRFLNAFKALVMFWIINGHIMMLMIQTAKNILYSDALLNGLMHFLIGATFGVDLFFTMTGFLTCYLLFDSGHAYKMKLGTWLYLSFHRYWRLAPMYLLTFWFSRSVIQLLGSGPLWDYGTASLTFRGLCNTESWWYPFTLTSNLHGLFDESMITSWYISCDMQFWLVSPIFITLLAKNPAMGWLVSLAAIFGSSKLRYDNLYTEQTARYDELVQPRADIFMRVSHDLPALYTQPHYRISAYIVGLLAGHYVYMVKSGKWNSRLVCNSPHSSPKVNNNSTINNNNNNNNPSKSTVNTNNITKEDTNKTRNVIGYTGLVLFLIMAFVSYLMSHFFPAILLKHSKLIACIAYSIDHLMMAIGASLCLVAMCFGQWPRIVNLLSHPNWTRLSKLNFSLLLLQCEAIYYQIFRYDQIPVAGTKELINILFNLIVTLYPAALFTTLAFEFPLANMEKMLI